MPYLDIHTWCSKTHIVGTIWKKSCVLLRWMNARNWMNEWLYEWVYLKVTSWYYIFWTKYIIIINKLWIYINTTSGVPKGIRQVKYFSRCGFYFHLWIMITISIDLLHQLIKIPCDIRIGRGKGNYILSLMLIYYMIRLLCTHMQSVVFAKNTTIEIVSLGSVGRCFGFQISGRYI